MSDYATVTHGPFGSPVTHDATLRCSYCTPVKAVRARNEVTQEWWVLKPDGTDEGPYTALAAEKRAKILNGKPSADGEADCNNIIVHESVVELLKDDGHGGKGHTPTCFHNVGEGS